MSARSGGRRARHHEEEHENHERWLVTYADMLTVLMALFIVMFAMSVVDKKKFEEFKAGAGDSVGSGPTMLDGGAGLADGGSSMTLDVTAATAALQAQEQLSAAAAQDAAGLRAARERIAAALAETGLGDSVRFTVDERGLVVTVLTDDVLFALGSATLQDAGREVLDAVAAGLAALPNPVSIEGHTDDLPVTGGPFGSNWELSTARATSVLRHVLDTSAVPAARLSAAGYADQRPVADTSPAGRAANRRVEVVVRALAPSGPAAAPAPTAVPADLRSALRTELGQAAGPALAPLSPLSQSPTDEEH